MDYKVSLNIGQTNDLNEALNCTYYLLGNSIPSDVVQYFFPRNVKLDVRNHADCMAEAHAQVIQYRNCNIRTGDIIMRDLLRGCGILVTPSYILVSNNHPVLLHEIYSKTDWYDGSWSQSLIKLPGAKKHPARVFPHCGTTSQKQRCIAIPIAYVYATLANQMGWLEIEDIMDFIR